ANLLAQAEDSIIFQGQGAITGSVFKSGVLNRGVPADSGLLDLVPVLPLTAVQAVPVPLKTAGSAGVYCENTFTAVSQAYGLLQGGGQYGPYALVLQTTPYADSYAPLQFTLILTADRINPLMTAGFYGTGTLPTGFAATVSFTPGGTPSGNVSGSGVLVSL